MSQQNHDIEVIKEAFAKSFIEAMSSQSVEACADLLLSYEDCEALGVTPDISKEAYQAALVLQSENFFKEHSSFIEAKNAAIDSALSLENFVKIDTYKFKLQEGYEASFIKTISISMQERLVETVFYRVGFQIDDAVLVNGKIKINHLAFVRMYESHWDDINAKNTPYPFVEDKKQLRKIVEKYAKKEYIEVIDYCTGWYVHDGDLDLEKCDLTVNLIVTGDLTIKEPVAELRNNLIVLGKTSVNALYLEDESVNVLFLGGIDFKVAVFIIYCSGPYQVLNKPRGPLIYGASETLFVDSSEHVQCLYAPDAGFEDDYSECLAVKLIEKDQDGFEDLRLESILAAIRAGETIFKS